MFKRFIPFVHATSIYEIPVDFYLQHGVSLLLIDLDNTLDSYRLFQPTERASNYIRELKIAGITPVIISNNVGKRVKTYATHLETECIFKACKPFAKKIKKFLKERNVPLTQVMFVGDQLMTDTLAARGAHIRMVLTEKIVKEDQPTTHINRLFDRPIRHYLRKKGKLPDWRTKYGQK